MSNPFDFRVVDAAARKTKFVRRQPRAITPMMLLHVLVRSVSLRAVSLAMVGALLGGVSAVAVFQGIGPAGVAWLGEVFAQLARATDADASLAGFPGRVLVQDRTVLGWPKSCRKKYRGAANQRGRQPQARLQCVVDLVRGALVWARFDSFRRHDQKSARMDLLAFARCGDLLLRDRGYFTLVAIAKAMAAGIDVLTRLRFGTLLFDERTGRPFDLRHHLHHGCSIDRWVRVGEARLRLRLVCLPLSAAHTNQRRRQARADRDARLHHNRAYFHQLGWAIFLTSVPRASLGRPSLSARAIGTLYRLRWRIEIVFKAAKSHLWARELPPRASRHLVETLLWARLLALWLQLRDLRVFATAGAVSLLRHAALFAARLEQLLPLPPLHRDAFVRFITQPRRQRPNFHADFDQLFAPHTQ